MPEVRMTAADWQADHPLEHALERQRRARHADLIASIVADELQRAFPTFHPRAIAYPERHRMQIAWDEPDGTIRTHWLAWASDLSLLTYPPSLAAQLTRNAVEVLRGQYPGAFVPRPTVTVCGSAPQC